MLEEFIKELNKEEETTGIEQLKEVVKGKPAKKAIKDVTAAIALIGIESSIKGMKASAEGNLLHSQRCAGRCEIIKPVIEVLQAIIDYSE